MTAMTIGPQSLPEILHNAIDSLTPFLEAAEGLRVSCETRGWSPTAAESIALTWLHNVINASFKGPSA